MFPRLRSHFTRKITRSRRLAALIVMCFACSMLVQPSHAQQKLGQSGLQFLTVGTDARATGMGEAFVTMSGSSASMFYNPAGIAEVSSVDISGSQMKWIADIKYIAGTAAFAPWGGQYGVIGLSFVTIDYGEFNFTQVANNEQGYTDVNFGEKPLAYAAGLAYGRALSDKFSVGGQVKLAYQKLGKSQVAIITKTVNNAGQVVPETSLVMRDYSLSVPAFDFGTIYKTGLKSLAFGMSITNFSREVKYERESFQLPLTFKIGISMNVMDFVPGAGEDHSLYVSVDAAHPRSYYEYLNFGAEYTFMNTFVLRGGYVTHHDEYDLTAGVGVRKFGLAVDYSYVPQTRFSDIHRISVRYSL